MCNTWTSQETTGPRSAAPSDGCAACRDLTTRPPSSALRRSGSGDRCYARRAWRHRPLEDRRAIPHRGISRWHRGRGRRHPCQRCVAWRAHRSGCGKDGKRWRAAAIGAMAGALFAPVSQLPEAKEGWSVSAVAYVASGVLAGAIASGRRWAVLGAIGLFAVAHLSERFHWASLALVSVASAAPLGAIVGLALSLWRDAQRTRGAA